MPETSPMSAPKQEAASKTAAEFDMEAHIRINLPAYASTAAQHGWSLKVEGNVTCFSHEDNEVIIAAEQLAGLGITTPQMLDFVVLHELGHFREFKDDPQGYKALFDFIKSKGKALEGAYHGFFNCLQDIYVNHNTAQHSANYRTDSLTENKTIEFTDEVKQLYKKNLFPTRDFSKLAHSTQFSEYLLNLGMQTADDIVLSPEVRQIVDQEIYFVGETIKISDLLDRYFTPVIGRNTGAWRASISERFDLASQTLTPIFEKLLADDIKAGRDLKQTASKMEGLEPSLDDSKKAIQGIIKKAKETPQDRDKKEREKQATKVAEGAGLSPKQAKDFARILQEVQPQINEIVEIFKRVRVRDTTYVVEEAGHYKTGDRLDVNEAVIKYGKILSAPNKVELFTIDQYREKVNYHPKKIRLWLLPDLSSSMQGDQVDLQKITVALGAAMATLCLQAEYDPSVIKGELGIVGFEAKEEEILDPKNSATLAGVADAFTKLECNGGSTNDHYALKNVRDRIRAEHVATADAAQAAEVVDIIIEITDGDTTTPTASKKMISDLVELGAKIAAIRIKRHNDSGAVFNDIWNGTETKRGHEVDSVGQIGGVLRNVLSEWMKHYY